MSAIREWRRNYGWGYHLFAVIWYLASVGVTWWYFDAFPPPAMLFRLWWSFWLPLFLIPPVWAYIREPRTKRLMLNDRHR